MNEDYLFFINIEQNGKKFLINYFEIFFSKIKIKIFNLVF